VLHALVLCARALFYRVFPPSPPLPFPQRARLGHSAAGRVGRRAAVGYFYTEGAFGARGATTAQYRPSSLAPKRWDLAQGAAGYRPGMTRSNAAT